MSNPNLPVSKSKSNSLRVALIGCGRILKKHAEILSSNEIDGMVLDSVCDIEPEKAQQAAEKYHVPAFTDMHELMQHRNPDLVTILTPSGLHASHTIELADYGKDIIVEKPMALRLKDADSMLVACAKNNCRLFVVKQNRFNLPVVKLREALEAGRFGKLVLGTIRVRWCRDQAYYDQDEWRGTWAYDGGVLTNQASHHVDLLEWMMGEVESVHARSSTAMVDIETEDTAVATLKFSNGALGVIEATTATRPKDLEGSISILGATGTVEISGFAVNEMKTWQFADKQPVDEEIEQYSENPPNVYGFGHKAFYENVRDSILQGKPALVDGLEGRKSLELISALYESIETGKEVFLRFTPKKCRLGVIDD
ncbi:Gfo/Idh/MocA family protein [Planctobacterium marinum]|uniref:Oxidoreductase n=1 Tax=Planctobacterium marinum TaxID=1631968 RepID=A0AA48HIZ6_9ALTE|nr:oxidoreductase [Planctobacterium marinum]